MFWLLPMASTLGKNRPKTFKKPISNHSKPYIYYYYYNSYQMLLERYSAISGFPGDLFY